MSPRRREVLRELGIAAVAALFIVLAVSYTSDDLSVCLHAPCGRIIGCFVLTMALGERLTVTLPGRRSIAPLATAAALAFAITQPTQRQLAQAGVTDMAMHPYRWQVVVAFTAVAMVLGVLPDLIRRVSVDVVDLAPRLIGVSVVAVLFREVPFWGPSSALGPQRTSMTWVHDHMGAGIRVGLLMVGAASLGLLVELLISALIDSSRAHAPYARTLTDTLRSLGGVAAALVATATMIALAYPSLGLPAIPLLLLPLAVTQFGVRRFAGSRETYRQTIISLSKLTDASGYTAPGHSERVAALAVSMGRDLGMSDRETTDLEYAALLHDIGQVGLVDPIPRGATIMAAPSDQRRIAADGAHIVRETGVLDEVASILETQATPYRQTFEFGDDISMASRIIKVSNAFDDLSEGARGPVLQANALERIHLGLGYEYDPKVVASLGRVLGRKSL